MRINGVWIKIFCIIFERFGAKVKLIHKLIAVKTLVNSIVLSLFLKKVKKIKKVLAMLIRVYYIRKLALQFFNLTK